MPNQTFEKPEAIQHYNIGLNRSITRKQEVVHANIVYTFCSLIESEDKRKCTHFSVVHILLLFWLFHVCINK